MFSETVNHVKSYQKPTAYVTPTKHPSTSCNKNTSAVRNLSIHLDSGISLINASTSNEPISQISTRDINDHGYYTRKFLKRSLIPEEENDSDPQPDPFEDSGSSYSPSSSVVSDSSVSSAEIPIQIPIIVQDNFENDIQNKKQQSLIVNREVKFKKQKMVKSKKISQTKAIDTKPTENIIEQRNKIESQRLKVSVGVSEKNNGKRIRSKGHSCYFCQKIISTNFARHFETHHENESEVAKILAMPKNSKKRRDAFANLIRYEGFMDVINRFRNDIISVRCKEDDTIMRYGAFLYEKYSCTQSELIRQSMRQLGRLTLELKKQGAIFENLCEMLAPEKFDFIINATKEICQTTRDDISKKPEYNTPSLALKIGYAIKKCASIERGQCLRRGDLHKNRQYIGFLQLFNLEWNVRVSSNALSTLYSRKQNAEDLLPVTSDLLKLNNFLDTQIKKIKENISSLKYSELTSLTLARIIMFNKRRSGETAKMTLAQYSCRPNWKDVDMKESIDLIISKRVQYDILSENPYVFAIANTPSSHIRGHDCLKKWCNEAELNSPDLITSTELRKYVATVCQIFNLNDNEYDWLARHLGHDIRVHRQFYRLQENAVELTKVSRLLMAVDQGEAHKFAGKELKDIHLTDLEGINVEDQNREETGPLNETENDSENEEISQDSNITQHNNLELKSTESMWDTDSLISESKASGSEYIPSSSDESSSDALAKPNWWEIDQPNETKENINNSSGRNKVKNWLKQNQQFHSTNHSKKEKSSKEQVTEDVLPKIESNSKCQETKKTINILQNILIQTPSQVIEDSEGKQKGNGLTTNIQHQPETEQNKENKKEHHIDKKITISVTEKKNGKRIRDKRHACYFCMNYFQNMARHFEKRHADEIYVAKILAMTKFSKDRKEAFSYLIRAGDFNHNCEILSLTKGELILVRRPPARDASLYSYNDYGPCPNCLGFMVKKQLWHHLKTCNQKAQKITCDKNVIAESNAILNDVFGVNLSSSYIRRVVSKIREDEIGKCCVRDNLILRYGAMQFEKYFDTQAELIRQTMRQLGRLVLKLKELTNNKMLGLSDFLKPDRFDVIVQATKLLCVATENNQNRPQFNIPSLALKIGYALKKCACIERGSALKKGDLKKMKF
ncbi:hypothetical protein FQR65_LT18870 [Abscondita terminalis]|nr:hypothetical protein FQR65_LT18870 [Abscondita terminalis]